MDHLDVTHADIVSVSPSGRRRKVTRGALKPGMNIVVSGYGGISSIHRATEIRILED